MPGTTRNISYDFRRTAITWKPSGGLFCAEYMHPITTVETADMSEMEIRDAFGFTKTKPIVFKERGEDGQTIKTLSVSSMKLIRLDTDGKMGSLAITLEDGRELRICSAYLKEMQAARFTFETKVDDEE